jgi:hypothetical protein
MLSGKQEGTMASEWVKLTPQGKPEETVYVNLSKASSVWSLEKGSEIWFLAGVGENGLVRVNESPDTVLAKLQEAKNAHRT